MCSCAMGIFYYGEMKSCAGNVQNSITYAQDRNRNPVPAASVMSSIVLTPACLSIYQMLYEICSYLEKHMFPRKFYFNGCVLWYYSFAVSFTLDSQCIMGNSIHGYRKSFQTVDFCMHLFITPTLFRGGKELEICNKLHDLQKP